MTVDEILRKIEAARGDPAMLALTTAEIVLDGRPGLREAFEAAAIAHWFDARVLSVLLEADPLEAADLYEQMKTLPMVESFEARDGHNIHEATRLAVRLRMKREDPAWFQTLSARAAKCWTSDEPEYLIEVLFHRLSANPEAAASELTAAFKRWEREGRDEPRQALGVMLEELVRFPLDASARTRVLYLYCRIWVRRVPLVELELVARELVEMAHRVEGDQQQAECHALLGDILQAQGRVEAAVIEFETYRRILAGLVAREPENAAAQRELSVSHSRIGGIHERRSRWAEALAEYESSRRIRERLTARDPANTDWQRDLSVAHSHAGRMYETQGNLVQALAEFKSHRRIVEGLIARDPLNSRLQRDLAASHRSIGKVYEKQESLAEALAEFKMCKRIIEELAERDPANLGLRGDLSASKYNVAEVYVKQDRLADALDEFEANKQIISDLTALDPGNADWQHHLSVSCWWMARLFWRKGDKVRALAEARYAASILSRLTAIDPSNVQWESAWIGVRDLIGELEAA